MAWRREPKGPSKSVSTIGAWSGEQTEDFAQTYGQTHIEEETLPILADILRRIRDRNGHLSAQQEWFDEICPAEPPVVFEYQTRATQAGDLNDVLRATAARDTLKNASHALVQLLECVSFQATVAEKYVSGLQRRRGFSSLPDEILSVVLERAAYAADYRSDSELFGFHVAAPIQTVKAATRLSHSCQRFRRLILNMPAFYNRICSYMPSDLLSTCYERITTMNGGMDVRMYNGSVETMDFIHMALENSKIWHQYTHFCTFPGEGGELSVANLEYLANATHELDVPSLTCMSIQYPPSTVTLIQEGLRPDVLCYFKTWTMPKLSMLKLVNAIPSPFAGLATLRHLSLQMYQAGSGSGTFDLQPLVAFLGPCVLLEELDIELSCFAEVLWQATTTKKCANFDSVEKINISFQECNIRVVKTVMERLDFPNARFMELHIFIFYDSISAFEEPDMPHGDVHDILLAIFPDRTAFPKLLDLKLRIDITRTFRPIQVSLPFATLPNIKHLCLDVRNSILAPIPSGISLPSLRSLSLKHCRKLEVDWITSLLDVLKASRTFQPTQLEVESCRWTEYPVFTPSGELSTLTEQELENHYVGVTADEMRQLMT